MDGFNKDRKDCNICCYLNQYYLTVVISSFVYTFYFNKYEIVWPNNAQNVHMPKGLHTFSCHCIIRRRFIPCKNLKNYGIRSKGNTRYWILYISKKLALENVTILHWIFTLVFTFNLHFIEFTLVVISNELVQCVSCWKIWFLEEINKVWKCTNEILQIHINDPLIHQNVNSFKLPWECVGKM